MDPTEQIIVPPGLSLYSAKLIQRLKDGQPGDELSDEALTEVCGKSTGVDGDGYSYLMTAIRYCAKYHNVVWYRIRGAGRVRCANGSEIVGLVDQDRNSISRRAKKAAAKVLVASQRELPNDDCIRLNVLSAQMGALVMMTSVKVENRLEKLGATREPDMQLLLAAFGDKKDAPNVAR